MLRMNGRSAFPSPSQTQIIDTLFELEFSHPRALFESAAAGRSLEALPLLEQEGTQNEPPLHEQNDSWQQIDRETKEIRLPGGPKRDELKLKYTGAYHDARAALARLRDLRLFSEGKPEFLEALVEIANERLEGVDTSLLEEAKQCHLLAADGRTLRQDYRDVLLSAVEQSAEGTLLLNNPFVLESAGEKLVAERAQRRNDRTWKRLRGLSEDCVIDEQEFRSR